MENKENKCLACMGFGFTAEHSDHPHIDGDCYGECPIAVQCDWCEGTGEMNIRQHDNYAEWLNSQVQDESTDELPF